MGAFSLEFQHELQRESWALYTLGIVVIALRMFVAVPPVYHLLRPMLIVLVLDSPEQESSVFKIWSLMTI